MHACVDIVDAIRKKKKKDTVGAGREDTQREEI
jgi:hypothetical protein